MLPTSLFLLLGAAAGATLILNTTDPEPPPRSAARILGDFVEDFRRDQAAAQARTFGVHVTGKNGGQWTVTVAGGTAKNGVRDVRMTDGAPKEPTFVYRLDLQTLQAIDEGRLNALTAQGKAFPGDPTPMSVHWMPDAKEFDERPFSFHFWTRGLPEKVPFSKDVTRSVHGADNVVFYYQEGLRTVWSRLKKGDRVDAGGQPMVLPFPIMVIAIRGECRGKVGGEDVSAKAGEMVFIPPGTPYVWWNEADADAEAILVMFGENA